MVSWLEECDAGHDLTAPGAYLYRAGGSRVCRACFHASQEAEPKKAKMTKGSMTLGRPV